MYKRLMKAKVLIVSLFMLMIAACSKDKYNTIPTLTFKSVNATQFNLGDDLQFKFEVTDKEGDVNSSSQSDPPLYDTMWIEKNSYTCKDDGYSLIKSLVPDFQARKDLKAEFIVTLNYFSDISNNCTGRDDSSYFRFWIHDRAGHVSDTVRSPDIKLLKG